MIAGLIGVVNALVLHVVELIGVDGTAWLWNDVLNTDIHRWLVVPTAIVFGLLLTFAFERFNVKRVVQPEVDLLEEMNDAPDSVSWIVKVVVIGCLSLLAGAALGPEASLMMASVSIGALATKKGRLSPDRQLLIVASVGSLLVSFVASMVLVLIPLLILLQGAKKQGKQLTPRSATVVVVAALSSYGTIQLINWLAGHSGSRTLMPALPAFEPRDFVVAAALGFIGGFISFVILWLSQRAFKVAQKIEHWGVPAAPYAAAAVIGAVLGMIYLIGGQTVQFSGSVGSTELLRSSAQYGIAALGVLLLAKVLAIAWSHGTGYRGGLVFPSVYIGVTLGLMTSLLFPELGGAGAIIGGMTGMVAAALGSPIMAAIFLAAVLPFGPLWLVAACAVVGAWAYTRFQARIVAK